MFLLQVHRVLTCIYGSIRAQNQAETFPLWEELGCCQNILDLDSIPKGLNPGNGRPRGCSQQDRPKEMRATEAPV